MIEEADPIYSKLRLIDSALLLQTGVWKPPSTLPRDAVGSTQSRTDCAGAGVNYRFAFILFHANSACCLFQCCLSGLALLPCHTRRFCHASFPAKKHFRRVSELFSQQLDGNSRFYKAVDNALPCVGGEPEPKNNKNPLILSSRFIHRARHIVQRLNTDLTAQLSSCSALKV